MCVCINSKVLFADSHSQQLAFCAQGSTSPNWSNDCGSNFDCVDYAPATQTIPQATWAAIIADGFVDCTANIGPQVNCACTGNDFVQLDFSFTGAYSFPLAGVC